MAGFEVITEDLSIGDYTAKWIGKRCAVTGDLSGAVLVSG
jgi:hypothetical protein